MFVAKVKIFVPGVRVIIQLEGSSQLQALNPPLTCIWSPRDTLKTFNPVEPSSSNHSVISTENNTVFVISPP